MVISYTMWEENARGIQIEAERRVGMLRSKLLFADSHRASGTSLGLRQPLLLDGGNFGEDGDPFGFHFVAQPEGSFRAQQRPWLKMLRIAHGDLRCAAPADAQRMLCSPE